ncbi:MAG: hypothetical protein ABW025_07715, partial [Cellulomonas sp.]
MGRAVPAAPTDGATPVFESAAAPAERAASRKRPAMMLVAGLAFLCLLAGGWFIMGPLRSG